MSSRIFWTDFSKLCLWVWRRFLYLVEAERRRRTYVLTNKYLFRFNSAFIAGPGGRRSWMSVGEVPKPDAILSNLNHRNTRLRVQSKIFVKFLTGMKPCQDGEWGRMTRRHEGQCSSHTNLVLVPMKWTKWTPSSNSEQRALRCSKWVTAMKN